MFGGRERGLNQGWGMDLGVGGCCVTACVAEDYWRC